MPGQLVTQNPIVNGCFQVVLKIRLYLDPLLESRVMHESDLRKQLGTLEEVTIRIEQIAFETADPEAKSTLQCITKNLRPALSCGRSAGSLSKLRDNSSGKLMLQATDHLRIRL